MSELSHSAPSSVAGVFGSMEEAVRRIRDVSRGELRSRAAAAEGSEVLRVWWTTVADRLEDAGVTFLSQLPGELCLLAGSECAPDAV